MAMLYYFTSITLLISPILIKLFVEDDEVSTECAQVVGMSWRRTLEDESEAQDDECQCRGGNQV